MSGTERAAGGQDEFPRGSEDFPAVVLEECLAAFAHVRLRVSGTCMEPALKAGEAVLLVSARSHRPRVGDVVLARHAAGLRLHRLVWAPPLARWRTKADRASAWDPGLRPGDVLGTVVAIEGTTRPAASRTRAFASLLEILKQRVCKVV